MLRPRRECVARAPHTMPHQPNLFSPEPGESPSTTDPVALGRAARGPRRPREPHHESAWLRRTELLVRVIVRLYLGLLIIALPWMRFWTENGLFSYVTGTTFIANSGFLRGVVSGLGMLNVAIAFQELLFPRR